GGGVLGWGGGSGGGAALFVPAAGPAACDCRRLHALAAAAVRRRGAIRDAGALCADLESAARPADRVGLRVRLLLLWRNAAGVERGGGDFSPSPDRLGC